MGTRRPLIAGNWKLYITCSEAVETARQLVKLTAAAADVDVMIAPPFTALSAVSEVVKDSNVFLGAQNLFWEKEGAFTGQISAAMLISTGCRHVIIGHSERRQFFGETDETVNKKMRSAIKNDLIPVFCVGETENERESNQTFTVLDKQLHNGLEGFSANDLETLVIAYEPVWAIGTGDKTFGNVLAKSIRILYGGSVKPNNIAELMAMADIDGALVGGASLSAETFSRIVLY
ncbi:MAG: triose-phosphate isomerase [Deltaproteobacteria bacterium]|nr:triose-phosphate isomerase [Deltaproteobacteria bacterium]